MARLNYNTEEVKPDTGRSLWEAGRYAVEITGADVKPTKAGDGEYVEVELSTNEGRRIWGRYNVSNPSAEAERIGKSQFAALHHAAGLPALKDTDQLIGRRLEIDVGIKKRKDTGEDENVIRGYFPAGSAPSKPMAQAKPATGGTPVPPWAGGKAA